MLPALRIISALFVMTFGFAWTVGQAGLETTNKNLCDLATSVWPPITECHFANWIVWLWGIGTVAAAVFLIFDGFCWIRKLRVPTVSKSSETEADLSSHFPDIRVADSPNTLALFQGKENEKLIPLLEREKIIAWGRPRGMGEPPPLSIPGETWRTHQLEFHPHRDVPGRINQTFLKRKGTSETATYYDVLLNRQQLRFVWSGFEPEYELRRPSQDPDKAGEIEWNFDSFGPFIGMTAGPEQQIRIWNFQARGWNRTGNPLSKVSGYVRSDRTNRRYPVKINDGGNMIEPNRVRLIPVDQWFDVAALFGSASKNISIRDFVNEIVPFTFFFEYDGKRIRRTFTSEQIEPRIRQYEQLIRESLVQRSGIAVREISREESPKISLLDAARRAYSDTQDSTYAKMAESRLAGNHADPTPEETLLYYARAMLRRMKVTGRRAPSDIAKEHDMTEINIEVKDEGIIARKQYGNAVIDNLTLSKSDLDGFIERVRAFPQQPL